LAEGDVATLPRSAESAGRVRAWRAESTFGQPGLNAGRGMGVANGSAVAVAGGEALRVWNAGGGEPLRLRVAATDLETRPTIPAGPGFSTVLPPRTSLPPLLLPGAKKIEVNLAAEEAVMLEGGGTKPVTIFSGHKPVTRTLEGSWAAIVLVNLG